MSRGWIDRSARLRLVYALVDPVEHVIRYVGMSKRGIKRPIQHLNPLSWRKLEHLQLYSWAFRLYEETGLLPDIVVLDEGFESDEELRDAEAAAIEILLDEGCPLTNATNLTGRR